MCGVVKQVCKDHSSCKNPSFESTGCNMYEGIDSVMTGEGGKQMLLIQAVLGVVNDIVISLV